MKRDPFFSVRVGSINSNAPHPRYTVACEKCAYEFCVICNYSMGRCQKCGEKHFVDLNDDEDEKPRRRKRMSYQ
jgi:hypothetical protein